MLGVTICVQEGGSTVNYANQQTQSITSHADSDIRVLPAVLPVPDLIPHILSLYGNTFHPMYQY